MRKIGFPEEDSSFVDKGPFKGSKVKANDFGSSASKYGWDGSVDEIRAPFAKSGGAGSSGTGSTQQYAATSMGAGYSGSGKKKVGLIGTLVLVVIILAVLFAFIPLAKFLYHDVFDDDVPIVSELLGSRGSGGSSGSGDLGGSDNSDGSGSSGGWTGSGSQDGSRSLFSEEDGPEYTLLTTEAQKAVEDMVAGIDPYELADDLEYSLYRSLNQTTFEDLGLDVQDVVSWVLGDISYEDNDYSWVEIDGDRAEVDVTVTLHMVRDAYYEYYDKYDYDDSIEKKRDILADAFKDVMDDNERSECYVYIQFIREGGEWVVDPYSLRTAYEKMFDLY